MINSTLRANRYSVAVFLVLVWSSIVSFWGIQNTGYFTDEGASISAAQKPMGALLQMATVVDAVHLLYYFILKFWINIFGISEFATRSLSALAVSFTSVAIIWAIKPISNKSVSMVAGFIYPLLPIALWMSTDARSYGLAALLFTLAVGAFIRMKNGSLKWQISFLITAVLSVYMFMFSILGLLGVILYGILHKEYQYKGKIISLSLIFLLLSAPLVALARTQSGQVAWIPEVAVKELFQIVLYDQYFSGNRGVSWIFLVLAVAVIIYIMRKGGLKDIAIICMAVLGFPTMLLVLSEIIFGNSYYQVRYLSFTIPFAAVISSVGIFVISESVCKFFAKWINYNFLSIRAILMVLLSCLIFLPSGVEYGYSFRSNISATSSWKEVRMFLNENSNFGDALVMYSPHMLAMQDAYPEILDNLVLINEIDKTKWPHMDGIFEVKSGAISRSMIESSPSNVIWYVSDAYVRQQIDSSGQIISDLERDTQVMNESGFFKVEEYSHFSWGTVILKFQRQ